MDLHLHSICKGEKLSKISKKKDIFSIKLETEEYEGFYLLSDGTVMNAFETINDLDWEDAVGGVYYAIYEDGEEVDGGLMEYDSNSTLKDLDEFVQMCSGVSIADVIAFAEEPLYAELEDAIDDPEEFIAVLNGKKKKKPAKKPAKKKTRRIDPFKEKLQDGKYAGYYRLTNGGIVEIHEYMDGLDYEGSIGGVYYQMYDRDGIEDDGGVMEYSEGMGMDVFQNWLTEAHGTTIDSLIALEGEDEYDELEEKLDSIN